MKVKLYTDGACRGNPGVGGWGVLIQYANSETELLGYEPKTTNNRMELLAAIHGIQSVETGFKEMTVYTDSQYVCNGITKWVKKWKENGWKTASRKPVKNCDLWLTLDQLCAMHYIEWKWVRGHSGDIGNERADELANLAIDRFFGSDSEKD